MLNYVITVAISVIFVPHYLSIFWEPLRTNPWDIIVGIVLTWLLVGINIVGIKEAANLNVVLAVVDFATQLLLVAARLLPDLPPARSAGEHPLRRRAELERVPARDPGGDDRLHRDRDRLEPRGGGARSGALDPARDLVGRDRGLRDLLHASRGSHSRRCRSSTREVTTSRSSARARRTASRTTRCSGWSRTSTSTAPSCRSPRSTSASSPRRSCSSRRTRE